ncbi:chymotrypsin-1-like [Trichogramma pretiosum]|uniref:chymotrypsin-1-like n=1 Tax=Trichogramma pretiosum TaxID=7493 RepID=UPI000C7191B8|nr:chymotrypsin-1-like [Trichogramma pretiosum]
MEGGTYDYENKYKYQISIQKKSVRDGNFHHTCGGAIISDFHILTAAHCFVEENDLDKYQIKAGTSNLKETGILRSINSVVMDRRYPEKQDFDVAVIQLKNSLSIKHNSQYLSKINLPTDSTKSYMNNLATVTGFGLNGYKRGKDVNGKEIRIPKKDPWRRFMEVKVMQVPGNPACLLKNILCVVTIAKTSSRSINQNLCSGDSGGPLVYENTVIGVFSRSNEKDIMTDKKPIYFMKVSNFMGFIRQAMANEQDGIVKCGGSRVFSCMRFK